ncbi:MAG: transglutaminase domain-containing protein [Elusimicrobia bacterium]|nr:transglutaminase domain-containing protein [Elusimicrobiota bacterium]
MKKLTGVLVVAVLVAAGAQVLSRRQNGPRLSPAEQQALRDAPNDSEWQRSQDAAQIVNGAKSFGKQAAAQATSRTQTATQPQGRQSEVGRQPAAEAGVTGKDGLKDVARLCRWLGQAFQTRPAGGATVGKSTVQELLESRVLTGCHDWGLMLAALLRSAGYQANMVDTAGVQWMAAAAEAQRKGQQVKGFEGHVFVEAKIEGRWVLVDPGSARYIPDYDPANPLIPMEVGPQTSYCVMFKGLDPADYGVDSIQTLNQHMLDFARDTDPAKLSAPNCQVRELPDPR